MPYFLVHTVVTIPEGENEAGLTARRAAEIERARQLQEDGSLIVLWREAGRLASYGVWRARTAIELRERVATLPMSRYMTVELVELEQHPNAIRSFPFA